MSVNVCPDDIFSVCPIVSAQYLINRSTIFFTKLTIVVYYHEAMCHAEKLVHYLSCQGHSEGLCNQNGGGGGFFLMCEDLGRMFDSSFPACTFFFKVEISLHKLIPLFRRGSVHGGSAR